MLCQRTTNTDSDGFADWQEFDSDNPLLAWDDNGNPVFPSFTTVSQMVTGFGISDKYSTEINGLGKFFDDLRVAPFDSDPTVEDTDGDGLSDGEDAESLKKFDDRFYIANDYTTTVPQSQFVNTRWLQSEECYHSFEADAADWIESEALMIALSLGDAAAYLPIPSSGIWSKLQANTWTWGNLDNAADMLYYYLVNSYSEITLCDDDMKEIISCHDNNMLHLKYNINELMSVAEQTTYNNTKVICTKADSNMRVVCMVDRECECELAGSEVNGQIHPTAICKLETAKQADWNLAVGSCYGGMVADVTSNGDNYTMDYRYYLLDIYEWAAHDSDPDELSVKIHRLHEIGIAHQYLISGYFEGTITWKKGETTADEDVMNQINRTLGI